MTVWVCSFDGADLLQDAPSWGCLSSWFSLKCVTAKWWWWCLSYSCGCSKGCGWRSHPAHSLCNISQTKPPSHPKTMGFLPSPETSVQNNAWKWVKDFGDALLSVRIRKTKAMEDAENSNIWGNLSEHLFGQASYCYSTHINEPALHPGIQVFHFNLLSWTMLWIDSKVADTAGFF